MMEDIAKDRAVNDYGLTCPDKKTCEQHCNKYLDTMPEKNKQYMREYLPK